MKRIIISILFVLLAHGNANAELTESLRNVMANELDAIIVDCDLGEKLAEARCFTLEYTTTALARVQLETFLLRFSDLAWIQAWTHDGALGRPFMWTRAGSRLYYGVWLLPTGHHTKVMLIDLSD